MNKFRKSPKRDPFQEVTNKIIENLEQGVLPWCKPWGAVHGAGNISFPLRHNGIPYKGINVISLWMMARAAGYVSPFWLSYKQAKELGGQVRKGETGATVFYSSSYIPKEAKESPSPDSEECESVRFMKHYTVFCADQIEGLPESFYAIPENPLNPAQRLEYAETFFQNVGAKVEYGGNRAFNSDTQNLIRVPPFEFFKTPEFFYSVLAHEHIHWTGAPSRLARTKGKSFGDNNYAFEELIAELGAAFLCAELGFFPETLENHTAYLASWVKRLKEDKRAIFRAASDAQRAFDYLVERQNVDDMEAA